MRKATELPFFISISPAPKVFIGPFSPANTSLKVISSLETIKSQTSSSKKDEISNTWFLIMVLICFLSSKTKHPKNQKIKKSKNQKKKKIKKKKKKQLK